jgi:gamma-glutamyltranspeptidase/glutathione hydrolase
MVFGFAEAREALVAKRFMVAAAHPLAAQAGADVVQRGGSAMDAAVAVQMMLGLVEPESSGIGGGAFLLYWSASEKKLRTYDGRESAPAAAKPDRFLNDGKPMGFIEAAVGGRSVGVPGVLRMLELAHGRHGRLPWSGLFEAAIRTADQGFLPTPKLRAALERENHLRDDPAARRVYYAGERVVNREYADTLRLIARGGAQVFYEGDLAKDMVLAVRTHAKPGDLTEEDLRAYRAIEREPVCGPYRALRLCSMGPPSSGGVAVLQILGLLERTRFARAPPQSADALHFFAEAGKLAYADRARYR